MCPALWDPMDCNLPGSSVPGILQEEYWSGLPCPSPRDLPDPGIEPMSLMSPALASRLFEENDQVFLEPWISEAKYFWKNSRIFNYKLIFTCKVDTVLGRSFCSACFVFAHSFKIHSIVICRYCLLYTTFLAQSF